MTFSEFKTALRNYEENEKSCNPNHSEDNVMYSKQKFDGKCYKCHKKGHKSSEFWMKTDINAVRNAEARPTIRRIAERARKTLLKR